MTFEIVIGLSFLAISAIAYIASRLPRKARFKYVDQNAKGHIKTEYTIVIYI